MQLLKTQSVKTDFIINQKNQKPDLVISSVFGNCISNTREAHTF